MQIGTQIQPFNGGHFGYPVGPLFTDVVIPNSKEIAIDERNILGSLVPQHIIP